MIAIDETGFVKTTISGVTLELDLYEVNNRLVEIRKENEEKTDRECNEAIKQYIADLGFPSCSHMTAVRFTTEIFRLVQGLEKKVESAESPSPTPN